MNDTPDFIAPTMDVSLEDQGANRIRSFLDLSLMPAYNAFFLSCRLQGRLMKPSCAPSATVIEPGTMVLWHLERT